MMKTTAIGRIAALMILFATVGESRDARADAMASYTFTNLGPTSSYSTDADGNRVIVASDGQKYAFPGSSAQSWSADSLAKVGVPTPDYDSNPNDPGFHTIDTYGIMSNQNGYFVGSAWIQAAYHYQLFQGGSYEPNELYSFQRMPDGSFGPAKVLYTQYVHFDQPGVLTNVIGINNNNMALASIAQLTDPGTVYLLLDLKTGYSTMLTPGFDGPLANSSAVGLRFGAPLALDDQGPHSLSGRSTGRRNDRERLGPGHPHRHLDRPHPSSRADDPGHARRRDRPVDPVVIGGVEGSQADQPGELIDG